MPGWSDLYKDLIRTIFARQSGYRPTKKEISMFFAPREACRVDSGADVMAMLCLMVDSNRAWSEEEVRTVHPSASLLLFTKGDVLERAGQGFRPTPKARTWAELARPIPVVQESMRPFIAWGEQA